MRFWSFGLLLFLLTATAKGQTAPSPAEQMLNDMLRPTAGTPTAPTTRPQSPQALEPAGYVPGPGTGALLREGSDIIAQHGRLKKIQDSPYSQFVFDKQPSSALAPMLVLPNLQLMSMENASSATKEDLNFTVSGMVTEYRNKNYILLEPGPDAVSHQTPLPLTRPEPAVQSPASADQMLKDMLSAGKPTVIPPSNNGSLQKDMTSGPAAVAPKAPTLTVLPEQTQIFDRVCRLSASNDGMHEQLTFDADGAALSDPPVLILPNLKLMDLEKVAGDRNTRLRVTGTITEYRGRNYILLQKVVVMADSDRQF
jgi:hypothetical protein